MKNPAGAENGKYERWINRRSTKRAMNKANRWGRSQGLYGANNPLAFSTQSQQRNIGAWLKAAEAADRAGRMAGGPNPDISGPQMYAPLTATTPMYADVAGPRGETADDAYKNAIYKDGRWQPQWQYGPRPYSEDRASAEWNWQQAHPNYQGPASGEEIRNQRASLDWILNPRQWYGPNSPRLPQDW